MAWNNASDLVVGGSGQVYLAPASTAIPTTVGGALNAAFVGTGYLSEDGVSISVAPNIQEFPVWQSRQPGRREALQQDITITGEFAQWNESTVSVWQGKALTAGSGTFSSAFAADTDALAEYALVTDVADGAENHRFVFGRVNPTGESTVQFNRQSLAVVPFELKVLAPAAGGSPGTYYSDSAGFAAGS